MPFGVMVGPIVISWFVASWFLFDKNKFINGFKNPWFLLMFAFILMHTISGFLSHNKHEGLSNIEVKLSFLAFPYFFFLFGVDTSIVKRMVVAFVSGCFFALMACLFRATYIYFNSGENEFFYSLFSFLIHAGYFSMYMLFCILILVFVYPLWFKGDKWLNMIRYFFIISFLIGIFLCASKMGYITAVIVLLLVPFIKFRERLNFKNVSVSIISLIVVITVLLKVFPKPFERINNALTAVSTTSIDKTSGESTAVRLLIWDASMEIIKENVLLGVGTGDANDILQERYKEKGLTGALEHNLNAHDQF
ncbi:MAG TPA: O-antigen ligase family protein, partial [Bacteroidia bacterium]|nr:O-antigen ligase family protein [Bacteroidia bacterium]